MPTPVDHALDELLILRAQDGDLRALDDLVSRWHARLPDARVRTVAVATLRNVPAEIAMR
jgi:hypothetical protein